MSVLTPTPGPWTVNTDPRYEGGKPCGVWGPKGPGYGYVCELPPVYPREFNAADANIIAAAPDLLAALKEMIPYARVAIRERVEAMVGNLYPGILLGQLEKAEKALAKAEGRD